jgi:hypothetical protein
MSVNGTWKLTMTTPMGVQTPTLTLASAGDSLSGTMDGAQGVAQIEDGRVDGASVSWAITAAQLGMKIAFSAAVDGDRISGKAALGAFGEATFEGVRS